MKINRSVVVSLAAVALFCVASGAMAQGGVDAYVESSVKGFYDIGVGAAGIIGACLLVVSFILMKFVGFGWTLWILGGMFGIGAIPLLVSQAGLTM